MRRGGGRVERGGVWWRWWSVVEGGCVVTSLISIQYVIIICNDVTRASLNKVGQNVLTTHFLASPHVRDTREGLILAYYELLYKCLYKIDKRLVISIALHLATLSSTSVMACLHGKAASYNLLEGIYANAVEQEVERLCVESCNGCQAGHPSQRQHDCLMMNENERWQMSA